MGTEVNTMKSYALAAFLVALESAFLVSIALPPPEAIRAVAASKHEAQARVERPSAPAGASVAARVELAIR
jgi:hypothetical protein